MKEQTNEGNVRIKIVGIGGGGENAVERMLEIGIPMIRCVTIHTDNGGFFRSHAETKIQIGAKETGGRGAGADPTVGQRSAQENRKEIEDAIKDCDMVFLAAGMGGGTGTGAIPVVAEIAKNMGILTIAVVTLPFAFEGQKRMRQALDGVANLEKIVDSLVVIPNNNLKRVCNSRITLSNAFEKADDVLVQTVKNLVDVIQTTAYINCDFADISSVVKDSGRMHVAVGVASGNNRAEKIIEQIKHNSLLDSSVDGATGVMLCISGAEDIGLDEIDSIAGKVSELASKNANIIFGLRFDDTMEEQLKAVLIATKK